MYTYIYTFCPAYYSSVCVFACVCVCVCVCVRLCLCLSDVHLCPPSPHPPPSPRCSVSNAFCAQKRIHEQHLQLQNMLYGQEGHIPTLS